MTHHRFAKSLAVALVGFAAAMAISVIPEATTNASEPPNIPKVQEPKVAVEAIESAVAAVVVTSDIDCYVARVEPIGVGDFDRILMRADIPSGCGSPAA